MLESISIHAPRTGSDPPFDYNRINAYISIHAPRTGSDVNRFCNRPCINAFQSTLPARGATFQQLMEHNWQIYFNPRSPHGERLAQSIYLSAPVHYFNPRSPHGERRHLRRHRWQAVQISIHAPRTGSDLCPKAARRSGRFQSTLPARGATASFRFCYSCSSFQSTLPARGATSARVTGLPLVADFNPRSPHGERLELAKAQIATEEISIHAPRTGSDEVTAWQMQEFTSFQSTLPARGATGLRTTWTRRCRFQSTLPARGATGLRTTWTMRCRFQSTLPARGATPMRVRDRRMVCISIHAPRTGSDSHSLCTIRARRHFNPRSPHGERHDGRRRTSAAAKDFNPRSPHGERHGDSFQRSQPYKFQSTLPARGATNLFFEAIRIIKISIHAPRTGSDGLGVTGFSLARNFNPRSPHGERPATDGNCTTIAKHFNPRSPHGERLEHPPTYGVDCRFQSTLPARGATTTETKSRAYMRISIHAPRTGSDVRRQPLRRILGISIHAPRTGSDGWVEDMYAYGRISIHAPRTGSDAYLCTPHGEEGNFNPRSPHGERQGAVRAAAEWRYFNPRSPHGERPDWYAMMRPARMISIHAPRTGSDETLSTMQRDKTDFNPRSPHGERRICFLKQSEL